MKLYKYFLFFCFLFIACDDNDDDKDIVPPVIPGGTLIGAEKVDDLDIVTLQEALERAFEDATNDIVNNDALVPVTAYRISYRTSNPYNGQTIIASGLLLIPEMDETPPIISYQHGTVVDDDEIPTRFKEKSDIFDLLTVLSGLKHIVAAPNYVGYRETGILSHPYEHGESLATVSYDMLVATKEFLANREIPHSNELILTGYDEGAYATMAMHEYIEKNTETVVTGSIIGGGAYNKTQFSKEIMAETKKLDYLNNYVWLIHSYNLIYDLNLPFSFFITEDNILEITSNIDDILDANIDERPQDLFTEEFRNLILTDGDHPFVDAIRNNNRFDWSPKATVWIYHGSEDEFVFPSNAITAYEAMRSEENEDLVVLNLIDGDEDDAKEIFNKDLPVTINNLRNLD